MDERANEGDQSLAGREGGCRIVRLNYGPGTSILRTFTNHLKELVEICINSSQMFAPSID